MGYFLKFVIKPGRKSAAIEYKKRPKKRNKKANNEIFTSVVIFNKSLSFQ